MFCINFILDTEIYLILLTVVGFYLLQHFTIIEIGAVMLFTSLLMVMAWIPYSDDLMQMKHKVVKDGLRKSTLAILIWVVLIIWMLLSVLGVV